MNNIYQHRYSWPLAKNEKVAMLLEQGFTPQQIYANHPDCHRNIPSTVMGRNWLRNQGIGGPLNNQRLMNGEVSVADLLAVKKQKLEEITKNDQIGYDSRDYCETPCILQFMVDGSLDIQKIDSFTDQHVELFELPLLQQCMDNGDLLCSDVIKYFKFLGPMRAQSELRMALQDSINANLLSFSQIFEIHSQGGPQNLADYVLTDIEKSYIKKETFTAVQLLKLPAHTRGLLNAAEMLFEKHSISHEDLTSYSPDDAQKIFSALPLLSLNRISIDKLMALSLQDAKKLSKPEVQKYFEMGLLCHQDIPNIQFFEVRYATDVVQSECSFTSGAMQELIDRKVVRMEDVILLQNLNDVRTTLAEYNSSLR